MQSNQPSTSETTAQAGSAAASEATRSAQPAAESTSAAAEGTAGAAAEMLPGDVDGSATANPAADAVAQAAQTFEDKWQAFIQEPSWSNAISVFGPMLVDLGIAIIGLVVLVIVTGLVSRWLAGLLRKALKRARVEETVANFVSLIARYAIWALAVPIAFQLFGIPATSLAAVIGAAGLAIGLGLQGSLSNIAAGLMLLILRPYRIGDYVELFDEMGEVIDIGIFHTVINTFGDVVVYLPNAEVLGDKIENLTGNRSRRIEVTIGVPYDCDLRKAEEAILNGVRDNVPMRTKEKDPRVLLKEFADSSINFDVYVWCPAREFLGVRHQTVHAINDALANAGIPIPFPQRDVNFPDELRVRKVGGSETERNDSETG